MNLKNANEFGEKIETRKCQSRDHFISQIRSPLTLPIKTVEVWMKTHRFVVHEFFTGKNRANRSLRGFFFWISRIGIMSEVHLRVYCIYLLELVPSAA